MTKQLKDIKTSKKLLILSTTLFFLIYIGRYNYTASLNYLISGNILTKSQAGLIGSIFFFVYGIGQIIFGFKGDINSPYKMILFGTAASAVANLSMFFCRDYISMLIVYGINGGVQSMIFPSLMVIISTNLIKKHKIPGLTMVAMTAPFALILSKGLVIIFGEFINIYFFYIFSSSLLAAVSVYWFLFSKVVKSNLITVKTKSEMEGRKNSWDSKGLLNLLWTTGLLTLFITVICRGLIDNGATTWIPTMIMESYTTTPSFSLILTLILPLGSILGSFASNILLKKIKCEMKTALFFMFVILIPLSGLIFIGKLNIFFIVALLFILYICKSGYHQMLTFNISSVFGSVGKTSLISGIMNAMASIGFTLSSYIFGFTAEKYGWQTTIFFWIGIILIAIIFAILSLKKWVKFKIELIKEER